MNYFLIFYLFLMPLIFMLSIYLSKLLSLYDYPDKLRKNHKKPIMILGGFFFEILFISASFFYFFSNNYDFLKSEEFKKNIILMIAISSSLLIGYLDDKKNLNPYIRLISLFFIYIISIYFLGESFNLSRLEFFFNYSIYLNKFSILFTALCFIVLVNASNMMDGINSLAALVFSVWIFFLTIFLSPSDLYFFINIILLIGLLIFSYFNFYNKCFLGDSGCYVLVSYICFMTVYTYNNHLMIDNGNYVLNVESFFLLFFLPGIDMIRLFIGRIYKGSNPLKGDKNHLHHFLFHDYGNKVSLIIYCSLVFIPWALYYLFSSLLPYLIISVLIIYSYLLITSNYEKN